MKKQSEKIKSKSKLTEHTSQKALQNTLAYAIHWVELPDNSTVTIKENKHNYCFLKQKKDRKIIVIITMIIIIIKYLIVSNVVNYLFRS